MYTVNTLSPESIMTLKEIFLRLGYLELNVPMRASNLPPFHHSSLRNGSELVPNFEPVFFTFRKPMNWLLVRKLV